MKQNKRTHRRATSPQEEQQAIGFLVNTHWSEQAWALYSMNGDYDHPNRKLNRHWRNLPEQQLEQFLKKAGKVFLTQLLVLPELAKRVPTGLREEIAAHPSQTVRALVSNNPGFSRKERMTALLGTPLPDHQLTRIGKLLKQPTLNHDLRRTKQNRVAQTLEWDQLAPFTNQEANRLIRIPTRISLCLSMHPHINKGGWHHSAVSQPFFVWATEKDDPNLSGLTSAETQQALTEQLQKLVTGITGTQEREHLPTNVVTELENWTQAVLRSPRLQDRNGCPLPVKLLTHWIKKWDKSVVEHDGYAILRSWVAKPDTPSVNCIWDLTAEHRVRQVSNVILNWLNGTNPERTATPNPSVNTTRTSNRPKTQQDTELLFGFEAYLNQQHTHPTNIPAVEHAEYLMRTTPAHIIREQYPAAAELVCRTLDVPYNMVNRFFTAASYSGCVTGAEVLNVLKSPVHSRELLRILAEGLEHGCHQLDATKPVDWLLPTQNIEGRLAVLHKYLPAGYLFKKHQEETDKFLQTRHPNLNREAARVMADTNPEHTLRDITATLGH